MLTFKICFEGQVHLHLGHTCTLIYSKNHHFREWNCMRNMSGRWVSIHRVWKAVPWVQQAWHLFSVMLTFVIALCSEEMSLYCLFYKIVRLLVMCNYKMYLQRTMNKSKSRMEQGGELPALALPQTRFLNSLKSEVGTQWNKAWASPQLLLGASPDVKPPCPSLPFLCLSPASSSVLQLFLSPSFSTSQPSQHRQSYFNKCSCAPKSQLSYFYWKTKLRYL